ncbi:MAG: hypothetical protein H6Q42_3779 [Deltaproteobacteria bacterium]|jgi:hypothetical protein|nr:hypothetical protein [Deltaproteobacteria bacterium]
MQIKEPKLESRKNGKSLFLLDNHKPERGIETFSTITIQPGGIAQAKYRGRRIGIRITNTAGNEFVGTIFSFEFPIEKFEDLAINDLIKFSEENIFGYDPPMRNN